MLLGQLGVSRYTKASGCCGATLKSDSAEPMDEPYGRICERGCKIYVDCLSLQTKFPASKVWDSFVYCSSVLNKFQATRCFNGWKAY